MHATLPAYAELHCLSAFSFLRGASLPEELVAHAKAQGYAALAITDECSVAGVVRAHQAAKEAGLALLIGAEFCLACGMQLVALAQNRAGYGNLCALITLARRRAPKGQYRLSRGDLEGLGCAGALPDCLVLWVPPAPLVEASLADGRWLAERFAGRAWIAAELLCGFDDAGRLEDLTELGAACNLRLVAAGDVHMHERKRRALQDTMTALRLNTTVDAAGYALYPNGERHLRSRVRLARFYPPALLAETVRIADLCRFSLDELRYEYPDDVAPTGMAPDAHLAAEVAAGLARRYPAGVPDKVRAQVDHELQLIAELAYAPYFLTVHDIVRFARGRGILCQGRGSAANSAVCFALGITEVDPARASMLFERFISKERGEPPDIDVDFEHERREEVIQYLYAKYGRERAALTATVIRYRRKSALRDVGRALGFDATQIDALSASLAWWDKPEDWPERLAGVGLNPESPRVSRWIALAKLLRGFPRHLSQHVGGFVISRGPLSRLVPIENAAMAERSVIQWDKDDLDALGLLKIDILALGMLSAIRRALAMIGTRRGTPFALSDVLGNGAAEDRATYAMLCRGDSMGVFQVESRAQMAMLPRLKPRRFYDLVIEVAIVRPGPIQGDMVHPYLRRRDGREAIEAMPPAVEAVLGRTLGVPIFQEQVMQLAIVAAGFTPGEADRMRRAMAAWRRRGGLEAFQDKLMAGLAANGYSESFAQRISAQIQGFGEYGFPESHAASFALLVYASAWIKRHHPAAFLAALLNSQPMGFYRPAQLVQDARRHGVTVLPVDVTASAVEATLEDAAASGGASESATAAGFAPAAGALPAASPAAGTVQCAVAAAPPAVRLGLATVRGLSGVATERIVAERQSRPFADLGDFLARCALARDDLAALTAADALRTLAGHRRQAAWDAAAYPFRAAGGKGSASRLERTAAAGERSAGAVGDLLAAASREDQAVLLPAPREGEELVADYAHTGLTLRRHPLTLLRPRLAAHRFLPVAEANEAPDRKPARVAGLVTCRQRPGTASGVIFVTIEDETGWANVIVHATLAERQRAELLGARLLGVYGVIQREGRVVHLIAKRLVDCSAWLGELTVESRDFC
jgi:error-prone DNA polymerase